MMPVPAGTNKRDDGVAPLLPLGAMDTRTLLRPNRRKGPAA
jgi:hypothetical protein